MPSTRSNNRQRTLRLIVAFIAAEVAAAIIYAVAFTADGDWRLDYFLFAGAISFMVGLPFVLLGGVPLWLVLRWRRVETPWIYMLGGVVIAAAAYLLLVAMGMGAPSDHPLSFAENIVRPFHIARIGAAMIAGGVGAGIFWSIAIKRQG